MPNTHQIEPTETPETARPDAAGTAIAPRRAAWLLVCTIVGIVATYFASFALPHDPYIRYQLLDDTIQWRARGIYERIHFDPRSIDIAVIGNSRLERGIDAAGLSGNLERLMGRPVNVVNFSLAQEGRNLQWVLAKELLDRRPEVKLVILSLIEQAPRMSHPVFRHLAEPWAVVRGPLLINREYFTDIAYLPFRQLSLFAQSMAPSWFGRTPDFDRAAYWDPSVIDKPRDDGIVALDAKPDEAELRETALRRVQSITPPLLPAAAADFEFAVERHYIRKIAALGKAHGAALAFSYLPIYLNREPAQDKAFYEGQGIVFDATHMAGASGLYGDYGHFNQEGRDIHTAWLASRISGLVSDGVIAFGDR